MIESIVVRPNPITKWESFGSIEIERPRFTVTKMSTRDIGWFYEARFSLLAPSKSEALEWLNNGPGREVVFYNDDGNPDWEGFINSVTLTKGDAEVKNSLTQLSNEVWVRFQNLATGTVARSTVASSAVSQARYGQRDWVLNGGELGASEADQLAEIWLAQNYWATPQLQRLTIGREGRGAEGLRLEFYCLGWWHTLNWRVYNQTVLTGTAAASVIVTAILAACGQFIASSSIETNDITHTQEYDADRRGGDIISAIAKVGFSDHRPGVCGVRAGREFFFEPAVLSGAEV